MYRFSLKGKAEGAQDFKEETFTLTVSAHGALIVLAAKVALGQTVRLTNLKNKDQHEATVAFLGPPYAGLATVGIQFSHRRRNFGPSLRRLRIGKRLSACAVDKQTLTTKISLS